MRLYWNPPVEDKRNGKITAYKVRLFYLSSSLEYEFVVRIVYKMILEIDK